MTPRQSFKFAFLAKCAAAGCSRAQTQEAIRYTKQSNILAHLLEMGLIGSAGLGVGGGYAAAKMTEPDVDVDDAKKQELIAAYNLHADRARRMAQRYSYRPTAPRSPRLLTDNVAQLA